MSFQDGSQTLFRAKDLILTFKKYNWEATIPCFLENFNRTDAVSHSIQGTWISPTVETDAAEYPVFSMLFNVPTANWAESHGIMKNVTTVTRMLVAPPGEPCMVEMRLNRILEDPHLPGEKKPVGCIIQGFDVDWNIPMGLFRRGSFLLPKVYTITIQYMLAKTIIPFEKANQGKIELSEGPRGGEGGLRDPVGTAKYTPPSATRSVVDLSVTIKNEGWGGGYVTDDYKAVFGGKKRKSEE